jgi:hypothetical protein
MFGEGGIGTMNSRPPDSDLGAAVYDLRRRVARARLMALPAVLAGLGYLGLLAGYWSGQVGREWAAEAALVLLAVTWVCLLVAAAGLRHLAAWRCPACGASALPPGKAWSNRPILRWMLAPVTPRACLACGTSFRELGRAAG